MCIIERHCSVLQLSPSVCLFSRYLGEEEEGKSNGESRSKALLNKLHERAKARELQSRAAKEESDVQDTKTSEQSGVGKSKRKLEQQGKDKKQPKKKKKESFKEQEDVEDIAAEHTDLSDRKTRKKKNKKGNGMQAEKQHTGSCMQKASKKESE